MEQRYLACNLIVDLDRTSLVHLSLLRPVFEATREVLMKNMRGYIYPFYTLGSMILAQIAEDWSAADGFASRLIKDESNVRNTERHNGRIVDGRFLFGLTKRDILNADWHRLIGQLVNPNNCADTDFVIRALSAQSPEA